MKKIYCVLVCAIAISVASAQQKARINGYVMYVFDDSYSAYGSSNTYFSGTIEGGAQYGIGLEFMIKPSVCLELLWLNQSTHAPTSYQSSIVGSKVENFKLDMNYAMLGADRHQVLSNGKSEVYGGIFAGCAFLNLESPSNNKSSSAEKFAWLMRLGFNYWFTDKLGIKLQTQLLSIAQGIGGGFYFGTGGAGAGISTYSNMYQFGLGGGLSLRVGH
jgi:hypothetical protein